MVLVGASQQVFKERFSEEVAEEGDTENMIRCKVDIFVYSHRYALAFIRMTIKYNLFPISIRFYRNSHMSDTSLLLMLLLQCPTTLISLQGRQ
jgi:hypothetical protein